jgi:hypothetical protein
MKFRRGRKVGPRLRGDDGLLGWDLRPANHDSIVVPA